MCISNEVCEYEARACARLVLAMGRYQEQAESQVDTADRLVDLSIAAECGSQAIAVLLVIMAKITGPKLAKSMVLLERVQKNVSWVVQERESLRLALT